MNQCIVSGQIVSDISVGNAGQTSIAHFVIKNEEYIKGSNTRIAFIPVKFFGARADAVTKYLKKGRNVMVQGSWSVEVFQDQQGQKQTKHVLKGFNFEFMAGSRQNDSGSTNDQQGQSVPPQQPNAQPQTSQAPYQQTYQQPVQQPQQNFQSPAPAQGYNPPQQNTGGQYNQNPNNLW